MLSNKYITQAEIAKTLKKSSNTIYRNIKTLRKLQIYEKTIKNFFIYNYDEEIKDGELVCTDMIYYSKNLKKR